MPELALDPLCAILEHESVPVEFWIHALVESRTGFVTNSDVFERTLVNLHCDLTQKTCDGAILFMGPPGTVIGHNALNSMNRIELVQSGPEKYVAEWNTQRDPFAGDLRRRSTTHTFTFDPNAGTVVHDIERTGSSAMEAHGKASCPTAVWRY